MAKFNDHLNRLSEQNRSNKPIYAFGSSTPRSLSYLQKLATQDRVYNTTLKSPAEKPSVVVEATTKVPQPQPKGAIMSRSVQFAKRASGVTPLTNPSIESRMAKSLVTETPPLRKRPLISQSVSPSGRGGRILPKASELLNKRRSAPPAGVSQNSTAVRKRMIRTESYTKLSPTTESLFVGPQTSTLENVEVPSTVNISSVAETVLAINDSDGAVPMIKLEENSNLIESLPDETDQVGLVNVSPCILRPESDGLVSLSSSDETLDGIQEISIEELSENDANDFSVVQSTPDNEIISQGMEESHERLDSNPFLILIPTAEVEEKKLPLVPSGSPKSYHFVEPPRSTTASLNEALAAAPRSNGLSKTLTEEEAKAALAERRRIAREEMEKQKELERMREEEEQRQAELQKRREEEEFRRAEQEALELLELRNQEENARLQRAMEEAQKLKEEEERRVEAERSKQEEIERRTAEAEKKVEAERLEREEKIRREEEERIERKKVTTILF